MIVTHKISTKAMSVNADIARIDELYPDKEVTYTYIGMLSMDEGEPLTIYFNESIGNSTITEPWELFDIEKYKDRITNFPQLTTDMEIVTSTGISTVERITPTDGISVFARIADSKDVGNWAVYGGKLHTQKGNLLHSLWFEKIGLPHYGKAFDDIARGWYELVDSELQLVVYNEGYPEHVDTLFSNADRIADRVMRIEGVPEITDMQLYEVSGASRKRIGQTLTEEGTMEKVEQELTEDAKLALLMKYAGNDYLSFDAGGALRISLDKLDLAILPEIEKLRNSEGSVETKVAKAKEIAHAAATAKLAELLDIPGVSISFGALDLSDENMDWDDLLTPEEGE